MHRGVSQAASRCLLHTSASKGSHLAFTPEPEAGTGLHAPCVQCAGSIEDADEQGRDPGRPENALAAYDGPPAEASIGSTGALTGSRCGQAGRPLQLTSAC